MTDQILFALCCHEAGHILAAFAWEMEIVRAVVVQGHGGYVESLKPPRLDFLRYRRATEDWIRLDAEIRIRKHIRVALAGNVAEELVGVEHEPPTVDDVDWAFALDAASEIAEASEVHRVLTIERKRVRRFLSRHRDQLMGVAGALLVKPEMSTDDLQGIRSMLSLDVRRFREEHRLTRILRNKCLM